jgi:TetR/AcrR family transcriptional regulator
MPSSPPRRRGRPRRSDSQRSSAGSADAATAVAILDAAERLFAVQGFAATTVKQVADATGVNSALLYYYFTDKETLYRAVLRRLLGGLVVEGMEKVLASLPPRETIARLVHFQVRFLLAHPNAPRLMARELADHQAERAEDAITRLAATLFARLCAAVRAGQERGDFRRDLDPRFAAISIIAQVVYLFIARPAVGILLGHATREVPDEEILAFADHAEQFALAALAAPISPSGRTARPATVAPGRRRTT